MEFGPQGWNLGLKAWIEPQKGGGAYGEGEEEEGGGGEISPV